MRCGYVRAKRGAEYAAKDYAVKSKFGITSEKWALPFLADTVSERAATE